MGAARKQTTLNDPFKLTLLIFAIIAFMYFTAEVLKPLALSVLLSFALAPLARWLEKRGAPRALAVVLTVVMTLGLLGGVGYVVGEQLTTLANRLPDYQGNIEAKLKRVLRPGQQSAADRLKGLADRVEAKLKDTATRPAQTEVKQDSDGVTQNATPNISKVEIVQEPSFQERLRSSFGPYLEYLGVGSFVLILVLFILMGRDDLGDRIVTLFGHRQVSLTTRTMEEIAQRISRYLATFALVNSGYGLVVGLGLWAIGVPYPVLWGCLAASMRFIPYVGTAVAFVLPLVFSFAFFPGWTQPLEVFALFAVAETALNSFLEPVIYGKTTGVSALGLLVAAMFWTWLWGTMGLLLSTPLTVCLAVLGKFLPSLGFFATLLGEEAELDPDVRFYQRLVSLDRNGAIEVAESATKLWPRADVYDKILIPALIRAERDAGSGELDEKEQAFVWQVVEEVIGLLEGIPESDLRSHTAASDAKAATDGHAEDIAIELVGVAAADTSDVLVLKMLAQLLAPSQCHLNIITDVEIPLQVADRVADSDPKMVVVSHVPPDGLTQARYLVRKLRARFAELPVMVGRWGETGGSASATERLQGAGATNVVLSVTEARDRILARFFPGPDTTLGTAGTKSTAKGVEQTVAASA